MDAELEELEWLAALGDAPVAAASSSSSAATAARAPQEMLVDEPWDDDDEDVDGLRQLAQLGDVRPTRKYEQRGWKLLAFARSEKAKRQAEAALESERKKHQNTKALLSVAVALHPAIGRLLKCKPDAELSAEHLAIVHMKLACSPIAHGKGSEAHRRTQERITSAICDAFETVQTEYMRAVAVPLPTLTDVFGPVVVARIFGLSCQWDETSQRMAPLLSHCPASMRQPTSQSQAQVMAVSGNFYSACGERDHRHDLTWRCVAAEPWRARPLRLERTTADYIIEGLLRSIPLDLRDPAQVADIMDRNDCFVFSATMDRASSNLLSARWICGWVESELKQNRIVFHPELCSLHGVSLIKNRATSFRDVAGSLFSFTRWLRRSRNNELLVSGIHQRLTNHVIVMDAPRPENSREDCLALVHLVYGGIDAPYLWRTCKKSGMRVKSQLLVSLERLCDTIDLCATSTTIVWWNRVSVGSHEAVALNMPVGSVIFDDHAECVQRVCEAVMDIVSRRAWVDASLARWTNVATSVRRFLMGCLIGKVLPETLVDVRLELNLSDDLEESLCKMLKADSGDHSTRNKLQLIRLCRVLARPDIAWRLAVMVLAGEPVESLQYALLGHDREKVGLSELVHPLSSEIIACQRKLLSLASEFHLMPGSSWSLLARVGADLSDAGVRAFARKHILQLSAGLTQFFELRMSAGVYRLSWLTFSDVPDRRKSDMLAEFFATPQVCLSFAASQLAKMFPTPRDMMLHAPPILNAMLAMTDTSVDFSERSHNQLRQGLASHGPATSFARASERLLCRQFAAEHIIRGGSDPQVVPPSLCDDVAGSSARSSSNRRGVGGSAFQSFRNLRLATLKSLLAPSRPLTKEDVFDIEQTIADEWRLVRDDPIEYNLWLQVNQNKRCNRGASNDVGDVDRALADKAGSSVGASPAFRGLWGQDGTPAHILSPQTLLAVQAKRRRDVGGSMKPKAMVVEGPVPNRKDNVPPFRGSLHGCGCPANNACREHRVAGEQLRVLDALRRRLNNWVDGLSHEARADCSAVLWCEGSDGPAHGVAEVVSVLLVHACGKPKAQIFAQLGLLTTAADPQIAFAPPEIPATLRIMRRAHRMTFRDTVDEAHMSLWMVTSDELSLELLRRRSRWEFFAAESSPAIGDNLLDIVIAGRGAMIPPPRRDVANKTAVVNIPEEFDLGDPLAFGGRRAGLGGHPSTARGPGTEFARDDGAVASDSDLDGAPPAAFAEDVFDEMRDRAHVDMCDDISDVEADEPSHVVDVPAGVVEAAAAALLDDGEPVVEPMAEPTMEQGVASATIDGGGYVKSTMMPWAAKIKGVGRITVWPAIQPPHKQNCAARCYQHANCSYTRKRDRVTDAQILRWLFSAKPVGAEASVEERAEAKAAHSRLAAVMLSYEPPAHGQT